MINLVDRLHWASGGRVSAEVRGILQGTTFEAKNETENEPADGGTTTALSRRPTGSSGSAGKITSLLLQKRAKRTGSVTEKSGSGSVRRCEDSLLPRREKINSRGHRATQ